MKMFIVGLLASLMFFCGMLGMLVATGRVVVIPWLNFSNTYMYAIAPDKRLWAIPPNQNLNCEARQCKLEPASDVGNGLSQL